MIYFGCYYQPGYCSDVGWSIWFYWNEIPKYIRKKTTETNNLIKAIGIVVSENMAVDVKRKKYNGGDKRKDP